MHLVGKHSIVDIKLSLTKQVPDITTTDPPLSNIKLFSEAVLHSLVVVVVTDTLISPFVSISLLEDTFVVLTGLLLLSRKQFVMKSMNVSASFNVLI